MKIIEQHLFLVTTDLASYPKFIVAEKNILLATAKAQVIAEFYKKDGVVGTISIMNIPMLDTEKNEN